MKKNVAKSRNILEYFYSDGEMVDIQTAIGRYIEDIGPSPEATFWKLYLKNAQDAEYHEELHDMYTSMYAFVKTHTEFGVSIDARGKSVISTEKKKRKVQAENKSLDSIKDFVGFRIVIHSKKSELEQIYDVHKLGVLMVGFFEDMGYIPCDADQAKENKNFKPEEHPDVVVPDKTVIEGILGDYIGFFKNYSLYPKDNGYQSLHILFKDEHGRYIELQIRTLIQHGRAEDEYEGIEVKDDKEEDTSETNYSDASHNEYKKKYEYIPIDWDRLHVDGVAKVGKTIVDNVGFIRSLTIYQNKVRNRMK